MNRNVVLFPFYKAFAYDILFYYAISILYLTGVKNLPLSQVALISSVYSIVAIISQIPAAIIADNIGLRNSVIIGSILCMMWGVFYIIAPSFLWLVIAEVFCAFGYALRGVSESPLLYASLKKLGRVSEFAKIESKGSTIYFVFEALASIAAGYLYYINPYLPLIFATACSLVATIMSFYMKPVKTTDSKTAKERLAEMGHGFKFIFKSKRLHAIFMFAAVFFGVLSLSSLFIQTYLNDIKVSSTLFGYIFAIASVASAIGSAVQDKIEKKHRNKTLSVVSLTFISSFVVIGIISLVFTNFNVLVVTGIVIFILQSLLKGAYRIIIKEYVSRYTTASLRPKLMSIYYLVERFGSSILLFIASRTIDIASIGVNYCIFGFSLFIVIILILNYMSSRVGLDPSKYTKNDRMDLQENSN